MKCSLHCWQIIFYQVQRSSRMPLHLCHQSKHNLRRLFVLCSWSESSVFGICDIPLKPQMEKLLNLPEGALTKEIKLMQDLVSLFVEYQIPSDLLSFDGTKDTDEKGKVEAQKLRGGCSRRDWRREIETAWRISGSTKDDKNSTVYQFTEEFSKCYCSRVARHRTL